MDPRMGIIIFECTVLGFIVHLKLMLRFFYWTAIKKIKNPFKEDILNKNELV